MKKTVDYQGRRDVYGADRHSDRKTARIARDRHCGGGIVYLDRNPGMLRAADTQMAWGLGVWQMLEKQGSSHEKN